MNQKQKTPGRDILGYLLLGVSIIMLGKSICLCFSSDIWYDELFTVGMIEHSYGELIAFTARDVHPPLYYCIVKFAVELCKLVSAQANPVMVAKIVSVLPYFILLAYSVTFIRKRFGMFTGGLFLFCVIAMPQLSAYTVEVRMYSWALLFVTAAFLHAYGMVTAANQAETAYACVHIRQIHAVAFIGYGLAAAYTQYFACVAVIMVYLYVFAVFLVEDRHRIREWLICVAVSAACYVPWLYALLAQITSVNENYWILPLSWRTFGGCVKFIMKPAFTNEVLSTVLAVVLFAMYVSVFVHGTIKLYHYSREKCKNVADTGDYDTTQTDVQKQVPGRFTFAIAGVGVLAGLVIFGFVASVLLRPIFVYRYMIPALGCFWLGFAVMLDGIYGEKELCKLRMLQGHAQDKARDGRSTSRGNRNGRYLRIVAIAATGLIFIIGLRDYRAFMGEEEYKIRLMRETETALASIEEGDIVIYNFDQVQAVTSYYIDDTIDSYLWCGTPETLIQEIVRPYDIVEQTAQIQTWVDEGRTVWFIGSFNSREDIIAEWETTGLKAEETGSYLLERYWFNLYRIS